MTGVLNGRARALCARVLFAAAASVPVLSAAEAEVRPIRDFASAAAQAKRFGVPMLLVFGDAKDADAVLSAPGVRAACRRLVVAWLPATGTAAKRLDVTAPAVVVAAPSGEAAARLTVDGPPAELLKALDKAVGAVRDAALAAAGDGKAAEDTRRAAVETLGRLQTGAEVMVALLAAENPALRAAAQTALGSMGPPAVPPLFDGLASADGELRAACAAPAAKATRYLQAPPATFWKTATADERAAALAKWRTFWAEGETGRRVVEFCTANVGRQVGDGECGTLAVQAMHAAGARQGDFSDQRNYVWGRLLGAKEEVRPGDIVQMENAQFVTETAIITAPHHTAVVAKVLGPRNFEVLEANAGGRKAVGTGKLNLGTMTKGTAKIYRPIPAGPEK